MKTDTEPLNTEAVDADPAAGAEPRGPTATDDMVARRMFIKASGLAVPLILASFAVSRPAFAATCGPNLCNPGDACNPASCGPDICSPGSTLANPCNPDT